METCWSHCSVDRNNFFLDLAILTKCLASAVIVASSNSSVILSPRIRISFFLLLVGLDELFSTPKLTQFLPHSPSGNENCQRESNPILQRVHPCFSRSVFWVNFTASGKQSLSVKPEFKYMNHVSNSWAINKFTKFLGVKVASSCFKQLSLNTAAIFKLSTHFSFRARLLSSLVGALMLSPHNPLDVHAMIVSL